MTRFLLSMITLVALVVLGTPRAHANDAADRAKISDALSQLAQSAHTLGRSARNSRDRGVRRKFAPVANDLGDDLQALARRALRLDVGIDVVVRGLGPIGRDAQQLVDLADEADDKMERKSLRGQATQLQQTIVTARKIIEAYGMKKAAPPPAPAKVAMSDNAFRQLVGAVRGASFDDDKVNVIKHAAQTNYFTSNQLASLIGMLSFDDGKVDAAAAAWRRLVDPQNSFVIFKKLSFDSSRDELRKRVSR